MGTMQQSFTIMQYLLDFFLIQNTGYPHKIIFIAMIKLTDTWLEKKPKKKSQSCSRNLNLK